MINTTNWKEFRVGDLFNHIGKTAVIDPASKRPYKDETYSVPALSSTVINNSFGYYANPKEHNIIDRCCLSVTSNGDAGKVYFQNQPFVIAQDAYVIYLKNDDRENVYLFMACALEKLLMPKYSYTNKAGWNKVKKEIILLPAKNDKPDFDYMEEYIEEIKLKYINKLEKDNNENIDKALKITGLSYQDLNKDLTVKPADRYEEFRIGNLFEINSSKKIYHANQIIIYDKQIEGAHPYIVRSENNRGIRGFIKESEDNLNDRMTLSFAQDTFVAYFQPFKYFTGNKVKILKPKYNINENIFLYLETAINKAIKSFSWGSGSTEDTISNIKILLPAIDENTPDFDYMEKAIYIYILQKRLNLKNYLMKRK